MFLLYFRWHYVEVVKTLITAWGNFLWFGLHFFSAPILLRTYFSYWKGLYRPYRTRGLDIQEMLKVLGENMFSRIVGALIRSVFLASAAVVEIFILGAGLVVIAGWLVLPFVIGWGLTYPFF